MGIGVARAGAAWWAVCGTAVFACRSAPVGRPAQRQRLAGWRQQLTAPITRCSQAMRRRQMSCRRNGHSGPHMWAVVRTRCRVAQGRGGERMSEWQGSRQGSAAAARQAPSAPAPARAAARTCTAWTVSARCGRSGTGQTSGAMPTARPRTPGRQGGRSRGARLSGGSGRTPLRTLAGPAHPGGTDRTAAAAAAAVVTVAASGAGNHPHSPAHNSTPPGLTQGHHEQVCHQAQRALRRLRLHPAEEARRAAVTVAHGGLAARVRDSGSDSRRRQLLPRHCCHATAMCLAGSAAAVPPAPPRRSHAP